LRLRAGVAWRTNMGPTPSRWDGRGVGESPGPSALLQPAGRDEGGQPVAVLAVAPLQEALALARLLVPVEVDVVGAFTLPGFEPDLPQREAPAEVGPHGDQQVVHRLPADRERDHADAVGGRPDDQPDEPCRLRTRLALTGAGGLGSGSHCVRSL